MPSSHLSAASASARQDDGSRSDQLMVRPFLDAAYIFVFRTASEVIRRALLDMASDDAAAASVAERRRVSVRVGAISALLVKCRGSVEKDDEPWRRRINDTSADVT